jgi:hypothetical protein
VGSFCCLFPEESDEDDGDGNEDKGGGHLFFQCLNHHPAIGALSYAPPACAAVILLLTLPRSLNQPLVERRKR